MASRNIPCSVNGYAAGDLFQVTDGVAPVAPGDGLGEGAIVRLAEDDVVAPNKFRVLMGFHTNGTDAAGEEWWIPLSAVRKLENTDE